MTTRARLSAGVGVKQDREDARGPLRGEGLHQAPVFLLRALLLLGMARQ